MLHRLARVVEGRWALPSLIGLNTLAVLCFHHFVSLDGPTVMLLSFTCAVIVFTAAAGHMCTDYGRSQRT